MIENELNELRSALKKPFAVVCLDGRNEHGTHVIPLDLRNMPDSFMNSEELSYMAEEITSAAEEAGFHIGSAVGVEFSWVPEQVGDEGRIELSGYWEFKRIIPALSETMEYGGENE